MGGLMEATLIHHAAIVLFLLWLLDSFKCCHPVAYFISLIYLYMVHERYAVRLRRKVQFEEKRQSYQRRVLTDSETVRWLNHTVEKIWPVCMEEIVSQKILRPIIPWFMQKYKPWTVKEILLQHLYMGRCPPMFTEMRVLHQSTGDDHLVLELGMNFRTADDMSAILAVKLRKRLGFGIWAKLHLLGMHIEGKVLVGVKFMRQWPFLSRIRICFAEPPYFQMTVKPVFTHGLDVTELPGIAGWLDKLLALAFEQTLVQPNMLVVDVEKFASPVPDGWFSVDAKEPVAHAIVEVIEAAEMKPSDLNGLADPYVKGQLGPYRFRTKTQKKTLTPKWHEEFKIAIVSWESQNILNIEVRDKDRFVDDTMGDCSIDIANFRDGQRHDMWLSLQNIKMGRLHLAITVTEGGAKDAEQVYDQDNVDGEKKTPVEPDRIVPVDVPDKSARVSDQYEPIDIEGQKETGIWVHHPGVEVAQVWEPKKGKSRVVDNQVHAASGNSSFQSTPTGAFQNDSSSTDDNEDGNRTHRLNSFRRGLRKLKTAFQRGNRNEDQLNSVEESVSSPYANVRSVNTKEIGLNFVMDESLSTSSSAKTPKEGERESQEAGERESPNKGNVKDIAKGILKSAGKSAHGLKHAWSRKSSRKNKSESGPVPQEQTVPAPDSSEESLSSSVFSPQVEPLIRTPISSGSHSFRSNDPNTPRSKNLGIDDDTLSNKDNLDPVKTTTEIPSNGIGENDSFVEASSSQPLNDVKSVV